MDVLNRDQNKIGFDLIKNGQLAFLQTPLFEKYGRLEHGFSTRIGGCSRGSLESLNMAFHTEDNPDNVLENRRRFFDCFGIDFRQIVSAIQVHGTTINTFNDSQRGEGALPDSTRIKCDALVTSEPGLVLAAYAADCMLLYFYSADRPMIALAHAGKQGTLGRIGPQVIDYLCRQYQIKPDQLLVAMSPAVCRNCYQIGLKDAESFIEAGWADRRYLEPAENNLFKLDLASINMTQLLTAGINDDNIAISGLCTSCNPDLFYSYRRDQGHTGRMIGFIALKEQSRGQKVG